MKKSVVVVGAGLGGIAAAGRLARRGFDVTVIEQLGQPGGRCERLRCGDFQFDAGPTLFLMPAVFEETFADLGVSMWDTLDLVRLDPTYRVHFHDGSHIDLTSELPRMREQLERIEPGSFSKFLRFMAAGSEFMDLSLKYFVGRNFYTAWDHFNPFNIGLVLKMKALTRHIDFTSRFFRDPRLQAAFSFQNMYLGLSPFQAPATYALLQYSELGDGVWFPRGGMSRMVEAMVEAAEALGVRFVYDAPVKEIEVEGDRASAVRLENGDRIAADLILANADLPYVYRELLPDDGTARRLDRRRYSSSTLIYYWGVRGEASEKLLHHNVFLADHKYRESFDRIFKDLTLPDDPSFYVNVASATEPAMAPDGHHGLMVLVPVGHIDTANPQDWPDLTNRARNAALRGLARLGVSGLSSAIVEEATIGPLEYEQRYNLTKGAAFGLSHNFLQVGYLRPHNRHRRYRNLYFVGASTHPGTGLPIVLLSARLVVERIVKEQGATESSVVPRPAIEA